MADLAAMVVGGSASPAEAYVREAGSASLSEARSASLTEAEYRYEELSEVVSLRSYRASESYLCC